MKIIFFICFLFATSLSFSQTYKYDTVAGDPLKARIYTLKNGLKVYLSVYKNEPRIYTLIGVKVGSKNDPRETTGLAHYFEHMMFKGTTSMGTANWKAEKPYITTIDSLYEVYRFVKDTTKRKQLYHIIDSLSYIASGYAIPNEYFKLTSLLGATGTNAATSYDRTFYINDIPANRLEQWLQIEADRFKDPVLRLFHTELETIYEEKNMVMTNDGRKTSEALFNTLFQKHNYGTTIIGESDHIKNPSLKNIREFYDAYYVPNNMAIALSGDFDPDKTIALIDKQFGSMPSKTVAPYTFAPETPITAPIVKHVYGPDAETVSLAFRFGGATSKDALLLTMTDMILNNSVAGLVDLNLLNKQKVLSAGTYPMILADYSFQYFTGQPKEGQTMEEVKDLLLAQLDSIKKGAFPDWLPEAIINNMKLDQLKAFENNHARASSMLDAFIFGKNWNDVVHEYDALSKITKADIIEFVKTNFNTNYVVVYKHTGEDSTMEKIAKPAITPIQINRDAKSEFFAAIEQQKIDELKPVFIDYEKEIKRTKLTNGTELLYVNNPENDVYSLTWVFDFGTNHVREMNIALDYLNYLGTASYPNQKLIQEFYKLATTYHFSASDDQLKISITGLQSNYTKAILILQQLLSQPLPDEDALANLKSDILKTRADLKKNPRSIFSSLVAYGIYGKESPSTNILSKAELDTLRADYLIQLVKQLNNLPRRLFYYGPLTFDACITTCKPLEKQVHTSKLPIEKVFVEQQPTKNIVYLVDFKIKQTNILFVAKGAKGYNASLAPIVKLHNAYFGAGPGSMVFQEIREARSMAYSARSTYDEPEKKNDSYFNVAYIGTQADKVCNAMHAITDLMDSIPNSEKSFNMAKASIMQSLPSDRIIKREILSSFEGARKKGLNYDIRKDIYTKTPTITFEDVKAFHEANIKNQVQSIMILGKLEDLDMDCLKQFGEIKTMSLEEIFGY